MTQPAAGVKGTFLVVGALSAWLCLSLPVFAQEAYYWSYAQHPDLAYFDHPPMVAWLIWLGTHAFGDGAAGIRAGTWFCGLATAWFGWRLLREFGVDQAGQRAWLWLGIAVPALAAARFLANPDPPLVAAFSATLLALWRARTGSLRAWLLAGLAAGLALLSKYTGAFLAAGGLIVLLLDPAMRRQWLRPGPWVGVLTAALVFAPVVVWNARHDFESFRFQTEGRLARAAFDPLALLRCLGQQAGMLHPAMALAVPAALLWAVPRIRGSDQRCLWLCAFGLPLPVYLLANSLWIAVKINWFIPAYVPLLLAAVIWWRERGSAVLAARPRLLRLLGASLWLLPALLPLAPAVRLLRQSGGSTWTGWDEIAAAAEHWRGATAAAARAGGAPFFFAADYKDSAQLSHGLALLRQQAGGGTAAPVLAQNVFGEAALQFDHWEPPRRHIGADAIFVLPRPDERTEMVAQARQHFEQIEQVQRVEVVRLGRRVLEADIYVCHGYRGPGSTVAARPEGH